MLRLNASLRMLSFLAFVMLFASCKKDSKRVPFRATAATWYRVAPVQVPTPVTVNGIDYLTFAHVPGGGQGDATHMGSVKTYFNQLAYTANIEAPIPAPAGSLVAPVIDVLTYPVLGAPLPLIQTGDFTGLASIHASLNIPQQSNGKAVSSFFYNDKGDAVFISNSTASVITPVSASRAEFSGKALIVGGRGKFTNAVGEVDFKGYFNPNNPNEADYSVDGWISY